MSSSIVARPLFSRLVGRRVADTMRRYVARKAITYGAGIVSVLVLSWVWMGGSAGIIT